MMLKTSPVFPKELQEFGCYFFSILFIIEQQTHRFFLPEEVTKLFTECKNFGFLGDDCTVLNATQLFRLGGGKGEFLINPVTKTRSFPASYKGVQGQAIIQCWFNPKTGFNHFVNADMDGAITYDSLGKRPDGSRVSKTIREGFLQSVRVVQLA